MEKFSNYFYQSFATKVGGTVRDFNVRDIEIIDKHGDRMVKFYGLRTMVIRDRFVITGWTIRSFANLVSLVYY